MALGFRLFWQLSVLSSLTAAPAKKIIHVHFVYSVQHHLHVNFTGLNFANPLLTSNLIIDLACSRAAFNFKHSSYKNDKRAEDAQEIFICAIDKLPKKTLLGCNFESANYFLIESLVSWIH